MFLLSAIGVYALLAVAFAADALAAPIGGPLVARWLGLGAGVWGAVTAVLLALGVGRWLLGLRSFDDCAPSGACRLVLSFTAGAFVLCCLWTLLGLAQRLGPVEVAVTTAAAVPLALLGLRAARADVARIREDASALGPGVRWLWGAGILVFLLPYALQTLLPEHDWDAVSYHLPVAKQIVERGAFYVDPMLPQAVFPATVQLCYAVFLAAGLEQAVTPFNLAVSLVFVLAAHAAARHLFGTAAGGWALLLALATNIVLELGLDARTDQFLGVFTGAAVLAYLLWAERPARSGALLLAGMALGLAIGAKYTAGVVVVWIGISVLLAFRRAEARTRANLVALGGAALLLLPGLWWYLRNLVVLGDPLYPFVEGRKFYDAAGDLKLLAPAVHDIIARLGEPPAGFWEQPFDATKPQRMLAWWDLILRPSLYSNKPYHWLPFVLFAGLLLPVFDRSRRALWSWAFAWGSFALTSWVGNLIRYLLPFLVMLAVTAAATLARLPAGARRILLVALILNGGWNTVAEWRKLAAMEPGAWFAGEQDRDEFLARVGYNKAHGAANAMRALNLLRARGEVEPDAAVLMVGEWKSFHFANAALADLSYDGYRWLAELARAGGDFARVLASLRRQKVRFILVNTSYLGWCRKEYPMESEALSHRRFQRFGLYHLQRFLKAYTEEVWEAAGTYVYRVRSPGR